MKRIVLELVITVRDRRTDDQSERVFTRFPISVGRGIGNDLRLDVRTVSRQHGLFTRERGSLLQYMDLHSENGTFLDGVRIEPHVLVPLRDSNVLTLKPYQITFHLQHGRPRRDRHETAPLPLSQGGPPNVSLWKETLAQSKAMRLVRGQHSPTDLLCRSAEVIELLAEMIVLCRPPRSNDHSPLRSTKAPDELTAYLISPTSGQRALRELRDLLTEMFGEPPSFGAPS